MPIVGGRVLRVEAKKKEENNVESFEMNFAIDSITSNKSLLTIKYASKTEYAPNVAEIIVEGEMYYEDEEKKVKALAEDFKKFKADPKGKHPLPAEILEEVLTGLNYTTQAIGTLAAFALNIAAPINLPKTRVGAPAGAPMGATQPMPPAQKNQAG